MADADEMDREGRISLLEMDQQQSPITTDFEDKDLPYKNHLLQDIPSTSKYAAEEMSCSSINIKPTNEVIANIDPQNSMLDNGLASSQLTIDGDFTLEDNQFIKDNQVICKETLEAKESTNDVSIILADNGKGGQLQLYSLQNGQLILLDPQSMVNVTKVNVACSNSENELIVDLDSQEQDKKLEEEDTNTAESEDVIGYMLKGADGSVSYICDLDKCGRSFTSLGYLRYHQSCHISSNLPAARASEQICPDCGRKFSWPSHLKYHRLTHNNQRLFECTVDGCNKRFYTAQRRQVHLQTHTGERPYVCMQGGCKRRFTTAQNLQNHIRTHTGERPYECSVETCKRKFAEFSSLKKHLITHTGEKPYMCSICNKYFSQASSRTVHMKRQHADMFVSTEKSAKSVTAEPVSQQLPCEASNSELTEQLSDVLLTNPPTLPMQTTM